MKQTKIFYNVYYQKNNIGKVKKILSDKKLLGTIRDTIKATDDLRTMYIVATIPDKFVHIVDPTDLLQIIDTRDNPSIDS